MLGNNLFKYSCQINSGQNLFIFTAPEFQTSPVGQCIKNDIGNDEHPQFCKNAQVKFSNEKNVTQKVLHSLVF